jgi:hypothetical protein
LRQVTVQSVYVGTSGERFNRAFGVCCNGFGGVARSRCFASAALQSRQS